MGVNILFTVSDKAVSPDTIRRKVASASFGYVNAVAKIIQNLNSKVLDRNWKVFVECAATILSNFGMTRSGSFRGVRLTTKGNVIHKEILLSCWNKIGDQIIEIRNSVCDTGRSRDRYLLELSPHRREELIVAITSMTKRLLPFTMGKTSYGLVGASKILFSVLPEIVLPVDNGQWLRVFKTVYVEDVIKSMVLDIQRWENITGVKLNELGYSSGLTTLPSVYNVMAMAVPGRKMPK